MNRLEIETDHWIERYLAGRLSETEARRFEAYWIENPALVRDLERAAQLKSGLASLRAHGELEGMMRSSWWSGGLRLFALAASIAVVAIGATLWNGAREGAGVVLGASPAMLASLQDVALPRGSVHAVMRLRGTAPVDATVTLPATPQAIALRILPELAADGDLPADTLPDAGVDAHAAAAAPVYAVVLEREDGRAGGSALARIEGLAAAADGFVTVFADSRRLVPGRYRLLLEPAGGAEGASRFTIDVRADAPPP